MAVVKSHLPGEPPVVRGSVVSATALLYDGPTLLASGEIDSKHLPAQPNNMTGWIRSAYKTLGASMRVMLGQTDKLEYEVNDGEGSLQGRGSHQNKYTYILRNESGGVRQRLDIIIHSENYNKAYYKKRKDPNYKPAKRSNWKGVTYWKPGVRQYWVWVVDNWAVMTDEEFAERFPQWIGKIPVYGVSDPEQYRNMPQPSFEE